MENHHFKEDTYKIKYHKSSINGPFSMAMFNSQRVFPSHSKGLYRTAAASSGHNKVMIHNEQDAAVQVAMEARYNVAQTLPK
jgi:hypothetical protein